MPYLTAPASGLERPPTPEAACCLSDIEETVIITLPPRLDHVRKASERALAWCTLQGVAQATRDRIELPLVEALNNAIEHGCGAHTTPQVRLTVRVTAEAVFAEIQDPGTFAPAPDWTLLPKDPLAESGRGGFLIKNGTDDFTNTRTAAGHTLTLRWKTRPLAGYGLVAAAASEHTLEHLTADLANSCETVLGLTYFSGLLATSATFAQLLERVHERLRMMVRHDQLTLRFIEGDALVLYPVGSALNQPARIPLNHSTTEGRCILERRPLVGLAQPAAGKTDKLGLAGGPICLLLVEFGGQALGTLTATRSASAPAFSSGDVELLQAVADFIGIARATDNLWQERQQRLQLEQEIHVAAAIQRSLLPAEFPVHNHWWVHGECRPAREVGGDYFDVVTRPDGGVLLIIADVMGKGVPASLLAAMLRSSLRAMADLESAPERILTGINRQLFPDLEKLGMFITAVLVYLPADKKDLPHFANAGHCAPAVLRADGTIHESPGSAPPLGIFPESLYRRHPCAVTAGDRLLLYTDGCYEFAGPDGAMWGSANYLRFAASIRELNPTEFITALLDHTGIDLERTVTRDDRTLVVATLRP
ncbi:MAG: SpoIIE family protein phosphatase [Opitutus sp.]|nr:SpoIIE family protein phosphatase [Opitutus sp.]MCS6248110.1 SpoIIE family protein phosphatase [Opitutus sp.]MCS6273456.1 SpoIIE family protein phosphatase [Opitutus sp.]MCS6275808.1 SpoIIE family protein phosphatase [Opitutus sp.]MCS6300904.1 SpoIIE family protein phosphatase [Opitutus sp.]